jgi:hypothetical protein
MFFLENIQVYFQKEDGYHTLFGLREATFQNLLVV